MKTRKSAKQAAPVDLKKPAENLSVGFGARLHAINVRWPWLKIVLLMLFMGSVALGTEELLRHNVSRPVGVTTETNWEEGILEANTAKLLSTSTEVAEEELSETPETEQPASEAASRKLIALTFDDGPSSTQTPRLLEILREKDVKVTFFVVGSMAQKAPEVLLQEEAEGHEVASHTMTHANLTKSTIEGIKWEVEAMEGVFTDVLGRNPSLTRPPYGNINNNVRAYVNQPLILWTVDPEDWKDKDTATVRSRVVENAFDGAIVLMHDIYATTVDAVADIIDDLRAQGYEFLTVSELAAARGIVLQNGVAYGSFRP